MKARPVTLTATNVPNARRCYEDFWNKLVSITDGKAQPVSGALEGKVDTEHAGCIVIHTPKDRSSLQILGLPIRGETHKSKYVDVFIQLRQLLRGVRRSKNGLEFEIVSSVIRVQYVDSCPIGTKDAHVLFWMHFDLETERRKNHPLYHAQVAQDLIPEGATERSYRDTKDGTRRLDVPKIPTAPMDLPGVVYMILHDHLPNLVDSGWPRGIDENRNRLPRYSTSGFSSSQPTRTINCSWWYDHAGHSPTASNSPSR